jgi:hypothetical protein
MYVKRGRRRVHTPYMPDRYSPELERICTEKASSVMKGLSDAHAWACARDEVDPAGSRIQTLPCASCRCQTMRPTLLGPRLSLKKLSTSKHSRRLPPAARLPPSERWPQLKSRLGRKLLDEEGVTSVINAAVECGRRLDVVGGGPFAGGGLCEQLEGSAHDVAFSDEHIALYLHFDRFFQSECPQLSSRLIASMTSQGFEVPTQHELNVRCIEFHSYAVGGGLLQPGHRDDGSTLTLSILLSDPHDDQVGGGEFVTWAHDGTPVVHDSLSSGDAVLFHSCKAHNVAQVTSGVRRSLVVELWDHETNTQDRYH